MKDFPTARAAGATLRCLGPWADRYWAAQTLTRRDTREGPVPADPSERERWLEDLLARFGASPPEESSGWFTGQVTRRRGRQWLLDAHDGFPGPLMMGYGQHRCDSSNS